MNNRNPIDGETLGMEYECDSVPANFLGEIADKMGWRFTHDASVETPVFLTPKGIAITSSNPRKLSQLNLSSDRLGGEILSPILTLEDFEKLVTKFLLLVEHGYSQAVSERSGIHFHISCCPTLARLKNTIILASKFEPVFFYLGGMGYKFRGISNDAIYCRPITSFGPPAVPIATGYSTTFFSQVFNVEDLLVATSVEDFWDRYGDSRRYTRRYVQPARYSWINLFSNNPSGDSYHGTIEFRVFNFSMNPKFLLAVASLCQKYIQKIILSSFNEKILKETEINSVFSTDKGKAKVLFLELMRYLEVEDMHAYVLEKIFELTPEINLDPGYVHTHKNVDGLFFTKTPYSPKKISDEIRRPTYIDIHTLGG